MARRAVSSFGLILPVAVAVVAAFGLLRLGRQFPGATASPGLLVPFLLPVLALALEAAAFIALSVAQLGVLAPSPEVSTVAVRAKRTWPLLVLLALVLGVAELIPRGTEHPGAFANQLVETARGSCGAASRLVPIPLLGLSVRCGDPQRIEGPMPGVRGTQVSMQELRFADDLRRVQITDLDLTATRSLKVRLRAQQARVAGLAPWARSPRMSPTTRYLVLTALGAGLWLAICLAFRLRAPAEPPSAATPTTLVSRRIFWRLLLAVPGAALAAGFIMLDQDQAAPVAYLAALGAALLALGGLVALLRRAPVILNYLNYFSVF
jgi:hypothetical protein